MRRSSDDRTRSRRSWRLPMAIVLSLVVMIVAGSAVYAGYVSTAISTNLDRGAAMPTAPTPSDVPSPSADGGAAGGAESAPPAADQPLDFVLLGSDSRDPNDAGSGRSDTLILVHLNAAHDRAYLISFPRDMWVPIPGHGTAKINAAYAYGGTALSVQTLQELLDITIEHLAVMDFVGLIELTDQLGGVTITNDHAFTSHGYSYPKGEINVSGDEALWFVRERHALPRGDFDRAENQRKVVKAIIDKGLSPQVLANPAAFTGFVASLARSMTVDDGLTDSVIRRLAISSRLTPGGVILMQAPISGTGTSADGQSIDIVDQTKLAELSTALRNDTVDAYHAKYPAD